MNLLGVHQNSASKPSLFSSLWSVQVQHQTDVNDSLCRDCSSGASLNGLNVKKMPVNGRNALSLNEYSPTAARMSLKKASTCPSLFPGIPGQSIEEAIAKCSLITCKDGPAEQCQQAAGISRQQKNRNICEWLQKVSTTEALSESSSISSMVDTSLNISKKN